MNKPIKFAFVTCVQLGLSCIERIYEIGGKLDLLITLNDNKEVKKSGRIYLDDFAKRHKIPLIKINHINDIKVKNVLKEFSIDFLFIIGWSQIADNEIINIPHRGTFGIHPTLLPEGRGRAAIPWAILKGLKQTGVTLFKLDEGIDTGPIVDQIRIPIENKETAFTLYEKVNKAHEELISIAYRSIINNKLIIREQDHSKATEWLARRPADGEIFPSMTVEEADKLIRATTHPYPGAFIQTEEGKKIIWKVEMSNDNDIKNVLLLKDGTLSILDYEIVKMSE